MFFAIYQNTTVKKNWTLIISGYRPVEYLIIHNEQHYVPLLWQECIEKRGVFVGKACGPHGPYVPDVLFWSIVLFFSTVAMSAFLKDFKTSRYFPTKVEAPSSLPSSPSSFSSATAGASNGGYSQKFTRICVLLPPSGLRWEAQRLLDRFGSLEPEASDSGRVSWLRLWPSFRFLK